MRRPALMLLSIAALSCSGSDETFVGRHDFENARGQPRPPRAVHPDLPATLSAEVPPPPLTGGTLAITADQQHAIVADPDRDTISVVELATRRVETIILGPGDQPGRIAEDGAGLVHVVLRGGRALVTIDPQTSIVIARRALCAEPRGIAYAAATDLLYIACAEGKVLALPPAARAPSATFELHSDLRDIAVDSTGLWISRFRSGEAHSIDFEGHMRTRTKVFPRKEGGTSGVAWRMIKTPTGVAMIHQQMKPAGVTVQAGGYGGSGTGSSKCEGPIIQGAVSEHDLENRLYSRVVSIPDAVVPLDLAQSPNAEVYAIAAPGSAYVPVASSLQILDMLPRGVLTQTDCSHTRHIPVPDRAQVIAVAFDQQGSLYAQLREPAKLLILDGTQANWTITDTIELSSVSREDTGHAIFHTMAGAQIACASCHPEGADDGLVWKLEDDQRRTPSLLGTIAGTAPYHWDGAFDDLEGLLADVYRGRMSGLLLDAPQVSAIQHWLGTLPAPPAIAPADDAQATAIARGRALYEGVAACATCHAGERLTNNSFADVGTGGVFQVPSLIGVRWRAPYMHNGCAETLRARFVACGGDRHGETASLAPEEIDDLLAYLESL